MAMKIGFQTIVWWPFRDPLQYRLEVIAAAGYQGVELKETPRQLGGRIDYVLELFEKCKEKYELQRFDLIGLAGGSLRERMDFCGDFRPEYLYIEDWNDEEASEATDRGFTLAIHPHVFKPTHRLGRALELLDEHPNLKFLPDTAHLTIAGDDPVQAITFFKDRRERIAAVHLKDWTDEFGRSAHRYARGFVELGEGIVGLEAVLQALAQIKYEGWTLVEQDHTKTDARTSTLRCAKWLSERRFIPTTRVGLPEKPLRQAYTETRTVPQTSFLETVVSAGWQDLQSCYESIARAFFELCQLEVERHELVTFWTCSPAHEHINLVAVQPDYGYTLPIENVLNYRSSVSGEAIEEQTIRHFDLTFPSTRARFGSLRLLEATEPRRMLSIPVFNPWNPNHVRLLVNILHNKDRLPVDDDELFRLAIAVGHSTSSALDEVGSRMTAKVAMLIRKKKRLKEFAADLARLVEGAMGCKEVSIFLRNPTVNKLERIAQTSQESQAREGAEWYNTREEAISRILHRKEPCMMPRDWWEVVENRQPHDLVRRNACITTPFVSRDGTFLGFICCCGKQTQNRAGSLSGLFFSDDDNAILEAVVQGATPHLEALMDTERREKALGRLTHELKVPIVAIRGATQLIMRTPNIDKVFDYDYPGDIWSWSELMGRLIDNADLARYRTERMEIKTEETRLLAHVIAPAIRQAGLVLRERGFSSKKITYNNEMFKQFPEMWLDRNRFQQVIFNLLSNAVKYAYDDPELFEVEIDGAKDTRGFTIWFRDWGTGIKEGMEEIVFEEGVRGEDAITKNVAGQGLGLWVVRQIVERHGGTVRVTNRQWPTQLEMWLPYSLSVGTL